MNPPNMQGRPWVADRKSGRYQFWTTADQFFRVAWNSETGEYRVSEITKHGTLEPLFWTAHARVVGMFFNATLYPYGSEPSCGPVRVAETHGTYDEVMAAEPVSTPL